MVPRAQLIGHSPPARELVSMALENGTGMYAKDRVVERIPVGTPTTESAHTYW